MAHMETRDLAPRGAPSTWPAFLEWSKAQAAAAQADREQLRRERAQVDGPREFNAAEVIERHRREVAGF